MEVLNAVGLSSISSVLSRKPKKTISSSLKSPNVVNYNKNITKNTVNRLLCKHSSSHQTPLLTHPIFHHLKSASLPLSAITLPFFLESKARYYKQPIHNNFLILFPTCNNLTTFDATGCFGCWRGVWITRRKIICFDSPHCDGSFVCLYIIYWLFGLAVASSSNYSEWDWWAKKGSKACSCCPWWYSTTASYTFTYRIQNSAAHWGDPALHFLYNFYIFSQPWPSYYSLSFFLFFFWLSCFVCAKLYVYDCSQPEQYWLFNYQQTSTSMYLGVYAVFVNY